MLMENKEPWPVSSTKGLKNLCDQLDEIAQEEYLYGVGLPTKTTK